MLELQSSAVAYSAAAIVLDANKQVVYCRDERNAVLARQLVALSENEQLFCFEVYPASVDDGLKELFWEYDKKFAETLGVNIHDPFEDEDAEDEIAFLLSRDWWYDYPVKVE